MPLTIFCYSPVPRGGQLRPLCRASVTPKEGLKTIEICCVMVPDTSSLEAGSEGHSPSETCSTILLCFRLAFGGLSESLAFLVLETHHSHFCVCILFLAFSLGFCLQAVIFLEGHWPSQISPPTQVDLT